MGKVVMGWLYAMIGVGNHTPMLCAIRRVPTTFLQGSRSSPQALGLLLSTEFRRSHLRVIQAMRMASEIEFEVPRAIWDFIQWAVAVESDQILAPAPKVDLPKKTPIDSPVVIEALMP